MYSQQLQWFDISLSNIFLSMSRIIMVKLSSMYNCTITDYIIIIKASTAFGIATLQTMQRSIDRGEQQSSALILLFLYIMVKCSYNTQLAVSCFEANEWALYSNNQTIKARSCNRFFNFHWHDICSMSNAVLRLSTFSSSKNCLPPRRARVKVNP